MLKFLCGPRLHARAMALLVLVCGFIAAAPAHPQQSPAPNGTQFSNPVIWEDLADIDILRVGDAYYYSASNMHYSPGAPILRSYDLVHWDYIGHSVPVLDFGPKYDMDGGTAYVKGTWASFLGYRKSNATFYWGGCIEFKKTYIYTAAAAEGPWKRHAVLDNCYYDAGLLVDDDDTMYVAYGNKTIHVAQLSKDATQQVKTQEVYKWTGPGMIEGSRFYKVNGNYYIFVTHPANSELVLRSTNGPFGPYEMRPLVENAVSPVPQSGFPHQGGVVQTQNGDWSYMAFIDGFPAGRMPVLSPMRWDAEGWPHLDLTDNKWPASGSTSLKPHATKPLNGTDTFSGKALGPEWEWNHNPDNTRWKLDRGLTLQTATVTDDLYHARNTLTHRTLAPASSATIRLDVSKMKDGDRAGLAMLRDSSAWIGVKRDNGRYTVAMVKGLAMDRKWQTASTGTEVATAPLKGKTIWLRANADVHPGPGRTATFSYSLDGKKFTPLGDAFELNPSWQFFMAYRYGIFNYATKELGGAVKVASFSMEAAAQ